MKSYESYGFLQNAKDSYELLRIAMNSCDCDGLLVTANDHVSEKQKKRNIKHPLSLNGLLKLGCAKENQYREIY